MVYGLIILLLGVSLFPIARIVFSGETILFHEKGDFFFNLTQISHSK
jgi:hypothetical protein